MGIWTRSLLGACLALLTAACGSVAAGTPAGPSATPAAGPALTVTPARAVTGGQPLQVRMTGFPPHSTVEVYECVTLRSCGTAAALYASTGSAGSASVTFIAQPSVLTGYGATPQRCGAQCELVAITVKQPGSTSTTGPAATARLTFAAAPSATTDLAYSSLLSTSWISATQGWALAAQPCGQGACVRIARTTDAGRAWQVLPAPAARIQDGSVDCSAQACVSQISFATAQIGYIYGPGLLMTTDGGLTWHSQPGPQTETLTIAGGRVYRVTYVGTGCPGPCQPGLQETGVGSPRWRTLIGQLTEPGRSGSAQIVAAGSDVLVAMYGSLAGPIPAQAVLYRSADGGGTWRQEADPCAGLGPSGPKQEEDLIDMAAVAGGYFAGMCAPHSMTGTFVITSPDGGITWRPTAAALPGQLLGLVAAAGPVTMAVASDALVGNGTSTAKLLMTTDGGRSWVTAATDTQNLSTWNPIIGNTPAALDFETPLVGQWLGDPHGIWTTTDGGLHWTRVAFR